MGDTVRITGQTGRVGSATVRGLEAFKRTLDTAHAGDRIGVMLDVTADQVPRGATLTRA
ncbi:MAG TPA: hypothetical protein VN200_05270 [Rhodoglobus sp.]|nr:hypothetical protein [Rhodoglobus sp.]